MNIKNEKKNCFQKKDLNQKIFTKTKNRFQLFVIYHDTSRKELNTL